MTSSGGQGTVLRNIGMLARCLQDAEPDDASELPHAAVAWVDGQIVWVGPEVELPAAYGTWPTLDAEGQLVIPGLVDCHTHLTFGGDRADEFESRLRGASYESLAEAGGGIHATVRATRESDFETLLLTGQRNLERMISRGVTVVEAKSGYGLDCETELRQLQVYRHLGNTSGIEVVPTFLGAHTVPKEYQSHRDEYLAFLLQEMIPRVAEEGLARFVDVFIEGGAFSVDEARQVLGVAKGAGLGTKVHADQLSPGGGAELAAEMGAVSADHLEQVSAAGMRAMRDRGVVAVSLPIASLTLGVRPLPARQLLAAGVQVAVATDCNPGSAPAGDLQLAIYLACVAQRMTPAEAVRGATIEAARAVGLGDEVGSIEVGKRANFAVVNGTTVQNWLYLFRLGPVRRTVAFGETVWSSECAIAG